MKDSLNGWFLVLGLKECLVECATLCAKSEVILENLETDADKKAEDKCTCDNAGLNQDEKMIPYECSKCDASFETLSEIDKHFASVHHEKNRDPLELNEEIQQSKSPEKKVENSKDQKIFFIPIKKK